MQAEGDAGPPAQGWPWFLENEIFETLQVVILLVMLARYLSSTSPASPDPGSSWKP